VKGQGEAEPAMVIEVCQKTYTDTYHSGATNRSGFKVVGSKVEVTEMFSDRVAMIDGALSTYMWLITQMKESTKARCTVG